MNSTATAWNSALPERPMLAPSGSAKLATVREIRRLLSAASSMTGSVASDDVVENAMRREARMACRYRDAPSRATSATTGRYTAAISTASPAITVTMNTAMVVIRSTPNFATAPATIAKMPSGASSSTHHDPDQCLGGHVGEVGERVTLFVGQRGRGHRKDRDEYDQGEKIAVH